MPSISLRRRKQGHSATVVHHVIATVTARQLEVQPYKLSQKDIRRLKNKLHKPAKARKIVNDLKAMPVPPSSAHENGSSSSATKAFSLPPLDDAAFARFIALTPGGILADGGAKAGAFDLLAQGTATLLDASGRTAPLDRMTVFIYWWGYELACPKQVMETLKQMRTIQNTVFQFLQAFTLLQAPELSPFIRYIANYFDMEFNAIRSQDKGKGVVLAATWLLPLALIPRPWDFAMT